MKRRVENRRQLCKIFVVLAVLLLAGTAMVPLAGAKPLAHNYDFENIPDVDGDTTPSASDAAGIQNSAGYSAYGRTNYGAVAAYKALPNDALFMFIGHGTTNEEGTDKGGALLFYNGHEKSHIFSTKTGSWPSNPRVDRFLSDYSSNKLIKVRLVVLAGCYTADTSPTRGNLISAFYSKGANNVIGWYGGQYVPKLQSWSSNFWKRANDGESFYTAARNAADDAFWTWPIFDWKLNNFEFKGDDGYLKPAGYGS